MPRKLRVVESSSQPAAGERFDYGGVPERDACQLKTYAHGIRSVRRAAVQDVGKYLVQAKDLLPHGDFVRWVTAEFDMTARSAENYMNAALFLDGKPETVSHLPARIIYKLSAPSAPRGVVDRVVEAAEAGEPLPVATIREMLGKPMSQRDRDDLPELPEQGAGDFPPNDAEWQTLRFHRLLAEIRGNAEAADNFVGEFYGFEIPPLDREETDLAINYLKKMIAAAERLRRKLRGAA